MTTQTASALWHNVFPFNLTGLPALTVPCGVSREGLPIGLQLVSGAFRESLLLRAGYAYQTVTDWHLRRPPQCDAAPPMGS